MDLGRYRVKQCRHGWMMYSGAHHWPVPTCLDLYGEYSEAEIELMNCLVFEGQTVLDVGANIGDLTVPLARMVGNQGKVYAFEANPQPYNVLCANLALNDLEQVRPINAFVGRADEAPNPNFTGGRWPAAQVAIDDFGLEACALIKIDVDGGEKSVIESAHQTIARLRPALYFENDVRPLSEALLSHVMALDYNLYWHVAPVFRENNYFDNPHPFWPERGMMSSIMVLGLPKEWRLELPLPLPPIQDPRAWWE